MPKIAAALAVFLTVVTCIGYNTARYPVVWEMVALSDGFTRSRGSEPAAPFPESADSPQSEALASASSTGESAPRRKSDWSSSPEESETASQSTPARPSPTYASYHDGSASYTQDDSSYREDDSSRADHGGPDAEERSSYAGDDSGQTDYDYSHQYQGESYGDSFYASESSSGADEHSGYTYDGSAAVRGEGDLSRDEDWDSADRDKPVDRVAARPEQKGSGARWDAWNDSHGSQHAVDPLAPLEGSGTFGQGDDDSAVSASHVADESRVDTQGSSAVQGTADLAGEPVQAAGEANDASRPAETSSASADGYTYSGAEPHSYSTTPPDYTSTVQEGPSGESTADATAQSTLVPIKRADPDGHGCEPSAGASSDEALAAADSEAAVSICRVERLPPVDQVASFPDAQPLGPHEALPAYPSTGVE